MTGDVNLSSSAIGALAQLLPQPLVEDQVYHMRVGLAVDVDREASLCKQMRILLRRDEGCSRMRTQQAVELSTMTRAYLAPYVHDVSQTPFYLHGALSSIEHHR